MEAVLERGTVAPISDWRTIEMYYDDGRRITNPDILKSMAEAMRRYYEEDDELDSEEEE